MKEIEKEQYGTFELMRIHSWGEEFNRQVRILFLQKEKIITKQTMQEIIESEK